MSPEKKRRQPKIAWRELGKAGTGDGGRGTGEPVVDVAPVIPPVVAGPVEEKLPVAEPPVAKPPVATPPAASAISLAAALNAAAPVRDERPVPGHPSPVPAVPSPLSDPEAEVHRILARLATYQPVPRRAAVAVVEEEPAAIDPRAVRRGPSLADEEELAPAVTPAMLRDAARARKGRAELLLFRAGREIFALPLGAVEEAIESPVIASLPEMPGAMLGVFRLRERLVPTYSPAGALGVTLATPVGAALLARSGERRIALAVDDVEDVMELDLSTLRDPPVVDEIDGILLGVARFGRELVAVVDPEALISACIGGRTLETT